MELIIGTKVIDTRSKKEFTIIAKPNSGLIVKDSEGIVYIMTKGYVTFMLVNNEKVAVNV